MKKTLAAVLAAAMALSTATVAFAKDYEVDFSETLGSVDDIKGLDGKMGDSVKYLLNSVTMEDNTVVDGADIAKAMEDGKLTATVIVTSGQNKLSGRPTIKAGTANVSNDVEVVKYTWSKTQTEASYKWYRDAWDTIENVNVSKFKGGEEVTVVCVKGNNHTEFADPTDVANGNVDVYRKGDKDFQTILNGLNMAGWIDVTRGTKSVGRPQLTVAFAHTYSTSKSEATMKLRFTARKDIDQNTLQLNKGDTITSEEVKFTAEYHELSNYYEDMQLTTQEVSDNNVILKGGNLYDAIGDSKFTITFGDDIAMFEGKAAVNQKDINLYYSLAPIDEIVDAYPTVDFTFLTFKGNGAPTFQNTGSMVFAAKDDNTTIYLWDGEVLEPLTSKYDSTYKTETVSGVKKLGTYVIADQILEVEEEPEEPAEPVDSTPVAEPDEDEGGNPNTGAC